MKPYVLIWGSGDLASGVALRLQRVGIHVLMVEMAHPLAVRRSVSFAQAVYDGETTIEGITGKLISKPSEMLECWQKDIIPIIVDPNLTLLERFKPLVLVDARMRKSYADLPLELADLIIGLGPGFVIGQNCHAAVETNRGHFLGRVYWEGSPQADTGIPGKVQAYAKERVLHAPDDGQVITHIQIGDKVKAGDVILTVRKSDVTAPFDGVVRGLIHGGLNVRKGMKVGDVDPRPEVFRCWYASEKSLAIGGGVLEAILTKKNIRSKIWEG
jgi:xanthine dehydrogenase accessory factor